MSKSSAITMWKPAVRIAATLGAAALAFGGVIHLHHHRAAVAQAAAATPAVRAEQANRARSNFGALPLAFEANQGQTDPQVKYMARGSGYTVFLTANDAVFALHSPAPVAQSASRAADAAEHNRAHAAEKEATASISMKLAGGNAQPQIAAQNELPGHSNYFIGSDPSRWQTGVKQYARVAYRGVYPGVDMAFHGRQRQLEFDFIVAPGASAAPIAFNVAGARKISTDADGNLVLTSKAGNVLLHKPVAYQEKNNTREAVDAGFVVDANNKIGFTVGNYDRSRELTIDPTITYATYLGGTAEDDAYGIAINGGNAYVTGQTASTDFPTKTPLYGTNQSVSPATLDAFVTEISATGQLVYSTYLGGSGNDSGNAIAVDSSGNAYVTGGTNSPNFPVKSAYQNYQAGIDTFATELNPAGSALVFSTYLGGIGDDVAHGIAVDSTGVYVVGSTTSTNFPGVSNGFETTISGSSSGFVAKLTPGTPVALAYSSYLGGGTGDYASSVAVASGQAYVTGATLNVSGTFPITSSALQPKCGGVASGCGGKYDAFVTVVNPAASGASSLVYSSFLGGTADDQGYGIAVDGSGNVYVTGYTQSTSATFPLKNALYGTFKGTQQAFVTEANATGSALVYSTYLGGSLSQIGTGIAVDGSGNAYVTGQTTSTDFPTANYTQKNFGGGASDAFVSEIAAGGGSLPFSTYLGGTQPENSSGGLPIGAIAVDAAGANIYVAGNTGGAFPVSASGVAQSTYGGGSADAFVAAYATGASGGSFTIANGALSNTSGSPGVLSTATITVNSTGGFNSAVTLSCGVSPAVTNGPTCGFSGPQVSSGNQVTPPANGSVTASLNIATLAASSRLIPPANGRSGMFYAAIVPMFGLALAGAGFAPSGSRRRKLFGFMLLGMILTGLLLLPACGGSSSTGGGGGGTPANTYTITVTGSASGGSPVTGSPALTLTVN